MTAIELRDFRLGDASFAATGPAAVGVRLEAGATQGTWTSPWHEPGFPFTRLTPSWNAETPVGTWMSLTVQARRASGGETRWWTFGAWAAGDETVTRRSVAAKRDADGAVDTDTLSASVPFVAYRVRATLERHAGVLESAVLRLVTVSVSELAISVGSIPSPAGPGVGIDLDVPSYSQEIHAGEYPRYAGGGEAWCSPTSTAMVLAFWGKGPTAADMSWIDTRYADPQVIHAARHTYDGAYEGTGNWPFNTAYAATFGLRAFVTQLRSLAEAERFIAAGIPLIASVKVAPGALPGFLLPQGSSGHLLVIRGFTAAGDVISNDPAATDNATVRRVYPRAAFETAWLGGSQGTVYVIHPPSTPLPPRVEGAPASW